MVSVEGHRISGLFEAFEEKEAGQPADLYATIHSQDDWDSFRLPDIIHEHRLGNLHIMQNEESIVLEYLNPSFCRIILSRDYARGRYCFPSGGGLGRNHAKWVENCFLFGLLKQIIGFLHCRGGLMLHSASVSLGGQGVAFSASSGVGKSTHASLWKTRYGAKIFNGDMNACRIIEQKAWICGVPWCGTSKTSSAGSVPLRAVVFLEQAPENFVRRLGYIESVKHLTARSFLPNWDFTLMSGDYLLPAQNLANQIECYQLKCLPDISAAEAMYACLF